MKPCLDCKRPTTGSRCDDCARTQDKARGTRQARGYDAAHDALRADWAPLVATGAVKCARCREHISSTDSWDLDHRDDDRAEYLGPSHARCNRATSKKGTH